MNKEQLQSILKKITPYAKLPSQIDFDVNDRCLVMKVSENGVVANMQEDKSAFEGWAIVVKAVMPEINRVILDWMSPKYNPNQENAQRAHYNRFVMRVANFKKGYEWFDVADLRKMEVEAMQSLLDSKTIVVNFPKKTIDPVNNKEKKPEAYLERELVKLWSKIIPITDEQLPVGLFTSGVISKKNTLTPRGASQIDLWQLDDKTMHIYELKVEGNESIGIISELMFYVCTIQNIVNGMINYPDLTKEKSLRHFKEFAVAVATQGVNAVVGYFTAPKLHPLMMSDQLYNPILDILNDNTFGIEFKHKDISNLYDLILK